MRTALLALCRLIDRLCEAGAAFAALSCALLALMLIVESLSTSFLGWSQPWAVEYGAYFCAFTLLAGSGYALTCGAHIRVRIALEYLPARAGRLLDLACTLVALTVVSLLVSGLIDLAYRSHVRGSVSYYVMQTPLWVPQSLLALSALLLWLALAARVIRLLLGVPPEQAADASAPVHQGHAS
jgi:TRAP-type mannitol/chloroaromatic compound transport system permease small subunit